jgi:hypothetical protein
VFGNAVLIGIFVPEMEMLKITLHNEEFHKLNTSPYIVRVVKSGRIKLARHLVHRKDEECT